MAVQLINKSDFSEFVAIPSVVSDDRMNMHILDAEKFDVANSLPSGMLDAIKAYFTQPIEKWSRTRTYASGSYVLHNGVYYVSESSNAGNEPASGSAYWTAIALLTLWLSYIKPFWICKASTRFLLWHGRNITQYGLRNNIEDTSEALSDKARAELINDLESKATHYHTQLRKTMSDANYTYDGTVYSFSDCVKVGKGNFKIIQV